MPFSRSRSLQSIARSSTCWWARRTSRSARAWRRRGWSCRGRRGRRSRCCAGRRGCAWACEKARSERGVITASLRAGRRRPHAAGGRRRPRGQRARRAPSSARTIGTSAGSQPTSSHSPGPSTRTASWSSIGAGSPSYTRASQTRIRCAGGSGQPGASPSGPGSSAPSSTSDARAPRRARGAAPRAGPPPARPCRRAAPSRRPGAAARCGGPPAACAGRPGRRRSRRRRPATRSGVPGPAASSCTSCRRGCHTAASGRGPSAAGAAGRPGDRAGRGRVGMPRLLDDRRDRPRSSPTCPASHRGRAGSLALAVRAPTFAATPSGWSTLVGDEAEQMDHHPDVDLRWRTVTFTLSTHSAGGVTQLDVELAHRVLAAARAVGAAALPPPERVEMAPRLRRRGRRPAVLEGGARLPRDVAPGDAGLGARAARPAGRGPVAVVPARWTRRAPGAAASTSTSTCRRTAAGAGRGLPGGRRAARSATSTRPSWWVLADAEGNEVCVCTARPTPTAMQ